MANSGQHNNTHCDPTTAVSDFSPTVPAAVQETETNDNISRRSPGIQPPSPVSGSKQ